MSIAPRLHAFLDDQEAEYEVVGHAPTRSAMQSALICGIPAKQIAKAVLLEVGDLHLLAVLPADRRVSLTELHADLGGKPRLSDEEDLKFVFEDCAPGAVPPLGTGYGIATIVDNSLDDQPDIYFEAGDHVSLVHMGGQEFERLTRQARHGHFSERWATME